MGKGEVMVAGLIDLSDWHPGSCTAERALSRIGWLWRQSRRAADRRREDEVVQVHRVLDVGLVWLLLWLLVWLQVRQLGLLVGGASQLLGDATGSSPGRRPGARRRRGEKVIALGTWA